MSVPISSHYGTHICVLGSNKGQYRNLRLISPFFPKQSLIILTFVHLVRSGPLGGQSWSQARNSFNPAAWSPVNSDLNKLWSERSEIVLIPSCQFSQSSLWYEKLTGRERIVSTERKQLLQFAPLASISTDDLSTDIPHSKNSSQVVALLRGSRTRGGSA